MIQQSCLLISNSRYAGVQLIALRFDIDFVCESRKHQSNQCDQGDDQAGNLCTNFNVLEHKVASSKSLLKYLPRLAHFFFAVPSMRKMSRVPRHQQLRFLFSPEPSKETS